jgi:hypothetical protein
MPTAVIYYGDGRVYRVPEDGPAEAAPGYDTQIIVQREERTNRDYLYECDYYLWRDGKFLKVDLFGVLDYVINVLGIVKAGRSMSHRQFEKLLIEAQKNTDLPPCLENWKYGAS